MIKKKHHKRISRAIDKFQKRLGLLDWELAFMVGECHDHVVTSNSAASIHYNRVGRCATISISPFLKPSEIEECVVHELLHLMFLDIEAMLPDGVSAEAQVHSTIRRLEKIVLKGLK